MTAIRNRIKAHRVVRAGDLIPHEHNPRTHNDEQRAALSALYEEVGFARSVLAYEVVTPDGPRLKLIDGHLRSSLDPEQLLTVEVLDVNDDEARKLLLSMDPLAALAGFEQAALDRLRETVTTSSNALTLLWATANRAAEALAEHLPEAEAAARQSVPESFALLITCRSSAHQRDLLTRFKALGLSVKAHTI